MRPDQFNAHFKKNDPEFYYKNLVYKASLISQHICATKKLDDFYLRYLTRITKVAHQAILKLQEIDNSREYE